MSQTDHGNVDLRHTAALEKAGYILKYRAPTALWQSTVITAFIQLQGLWRGLQFSPVFHITLTATMWVLYFLVFIVVEDFLKRPNQFQPMSAKAARSWEKTRARGQARYLSRLTVLCTVAYGSCCLALLYLAYGPPVRSFQESGSAMAIWLLVLALVSILWSHGVWVYREERYSRTKLLLESSETTL
jgi:hypothetical protein